MKGSPCEGRTSKSSGSSRSFAIEASHSPSGSASGSLRLSETLEVIRGSTWSPAIISLPASSTRQACSGEWPLPTTTRQSRRPIRIVSPSCMRTMASGTGLTIAAKRPQPFSASVAILSSLQPAARQ